MPYIVLSGILKLRITSHCILIKFQSTLSINELFIYLPLLIYYLRFEITELKTTSKMLMQKCIDNCQIDFINSVHWHLIINNSHNNKYKIILEDFLHSLSSSVNSNIVHTFIHAGVVVVCSGMSIMKEVLHPQLDFALGLLKKKQVFIF